MGRAGNRQQVEPREADRPERGRTVAHDRDDVADEPPRVRESARQRALEEDAIDVHDRGLERARDRERDERRGHDDRTGGDRTRR